MLLRAEDVPFIAVDDNLNVLAFWNEPAWRRTRRTITWLYGSSSLLAVATDIMVLDVDYLLAVALD